MKKKSPATLFNAQTVPLQDSNLIEASAGTGKTYSIAILALRLILEKNIPIAEILMVTFTKAAVAELETRIRAFIRMAYQASKQIAISDATIQEMVSRSIDTVGIEETSDRLKKAILFLDETSILTIHSFCQRTLTEYAFETNQVFGAEALSESDLEELTVDAVNQFWRKYIVVMNTEVLAAITPVYFSREIVFETIKNVLGGKQILQLSPLAQNLLSNENISTLVLRINASKENMNAVIEEGEIYLTDNRDRLLEACIKDTYARNSLATLFDNIPRLLEAVIALADKKYVQKIFRDILPLLETLNTFKQTLNDLLNNFCNQLLQLSVLEINAQIQSEKEKASRLAFDDMIQKLHHAVIANNNQLLITALRKKYQAVFIDEFQDTDKQQYEIFNALFGSGSILFYIGDPKQSIYAWRKADIYTYFKAGNAVAHKYEMNTNYRSSKAIIEAQNNFFLPTPDFDTFYYENELDAIKYTNVNAPQANTNNGLYVANAPVVPISIISYKNKEDALTDVVCTVIDLLSNVDYELIDKEKKRKVRPSDIGILVRSNYQGANIKSALARYKIPAVTIDETKILESNEAKELLWVLEAVHDINLSKINKALLSSITGFDINTIKNLHEELVLQQFKNYQDAWLKEGVYVMLMKFMTDYNVKSNFLEDTVINGERILSNFLQLIELLHKTQVNKKYAPIELVHWMQKAIQGNAVEGDEFVQRIESDEDAVKIITIHKSKGLEYNIVIAPFLDMSAAISEIKKNKRKDRVIVNFRDNTNEQYVFANDNILNNEQLLEVEKQFEQENRRLMYVAITRAKYKCYLCKKSSKVSSSFSPFAEILITQKPSNIEFSEAPSIPLDFQYRSGVQEYPINYKLAENFSLLQTNWRKMSYTFLNPEHGYWVKPISTNKTDEYSEFVFRQLKKGNHTGILLHHIFEHIDFMEDTYWAATIEQSLKRLSPGNQDDYMLQLGNLLNEVLQVKLCCNGNEFTLAQVSTAQRINEFEFDFTVKPFQVEGIQKLSTDTVPLMVKNYKQLEGLMNGKVDLFFEYGGKYYILDWKSNFLGDQLEHYSNKAVDAAMAENNYHLQYHIYSVAVCKYLSQRLPNFDYETHFGGVLYLFLRGIRKEQTKGIFYAKPPVEVIQQMTELFGA
ncbi:MAG: UvrD-helicase domain-containing protein [Ferruginibacter sp.]